jgi:2-polyprenyl-6-methoxyphenol hydroxylase-like FAD-dependent oxidoreductase
MLDMPLIARRPTGPGLALVGDAALAPDPVWGNGIGWAIQAAEWLVDNTAEALGQRDPEAVDRGLEQYRRQHQAAFAGRFIRDADFAQVRPFNLFERLMYSAAAREPKLAKYTGPHTTRLAHIRYFPPLKAIVHALWINLTHRVRASGSIPGQRRHLPVR